MKFYGKVIEGKPKIYNLDAYREFFSNLSEGEGFEIRVRPSKDIRNLEMNNLYWAWLGELSLHSGYSKKELHEYFTQELLCKEIRVNNEPILDCESTADLTKKEFSHYLEGVARLSAQNFSFILGPLSLSVSP